MNPAAPVTSTDRFAISERGRYRYCVGARRAAPPEGPSRATTDVLPPILQILADGGPQTGFGHLGRCLAIAEELGDGAAYFEVSDEAAAEFVRSQGGRVGGEPAAVVLIDRRTHTDAAEVASHHADGRRVVLLDDAGSGRDTADLVIDPPTAVSWPPTPTPRLAGFEHVLLRRGVRAAAATASPSQTVLLTMGGSDPTAATPALAEAFADAGIEVSVAIGPGYRGERPRSGTLIDRPEQFIATLAGSGLLVASYGHTLLEAAYLGIPAVVVAALPEHREDAAAFCAHGTAVMCEISAGPQALVELVRELLADAERRMALSERGRQLVDGRGSERVAVAIRELAARAGHAGPVVASKDGWGAIECEACGWVHLDPLPSPAELAAMYAETYYEANPGWLAKDRSEQAYWDLEHADKLADWSELLGAPAGTLLDVGCSGGLLLEFAAQRGWRTIGIEPGSEAVEEARAHGIDVRQGLYEEVPIEPQSIDVVHTKLVAEHLPDPREFLRWTASVLRPGGVVCIHVPNDFNLLQLAARDALGKGDWWIAPPFHVNYFNFASLERLLAGAGFEPARRDATFPVEWFLLMGEDYVGDDDLGASVHRRRMALEAHLEALSLRRPLHAHLAELGLGREAIVHARLRA